MRTLTGIVSAIAITTSMISVPASAAVTLIDSVTPEDANSNTLAAMQDQCDDFASRHGPNWSGEVDLGSISSAWVSGPTENGTHSIDDAIGDPEGAGTFTPAHTEIRGDPYRNGGSVNMFGDAYAVGGYYSASKYDFEGEFDSTYAFSFNCNMSETVRIPVQGYYVVNEDARGNEEAHQQSCNAFTAHGPTWKHWGADHAQCDWVETEAAHDDEQARDDEAGTPVNQTQTDTLLAHEDNGEGFFDDETLAIGKVVVCISPSKTGPKGAPGTWLNHNGYTGNKCTTVWYEGGAKTGVSNLNDGSHNWVTVPIV